MILGEMIYLILFNSKKQKQIQGGFQSKTQIRSLRTCIVKLVNPLRNWLTNTMYPCDISQARSNWASLFTYNVPCFCFYRTIPTWI